MVLRMQGAPAPEVVRWTRSAGSQARVLSPPELVDRVRREVQKMARAHPARASARQILPGLKKQKPKHLMLLLRFQSLLRQG